MQVTFKEVLSAALQENKATLQSVNRNLWEVAKSTKKKPGFIKVAVEDEFAMSMMSQKEVAFIISMDGDELNRIASELEKAKGEPT